MGGPHYGNNWLEEEGEEKLKIKVYNDTQYHKNECGMRKIRVSMNAVKYEGSFNMLAKLLVKLLKASKLNSSSASLSTHLTRALTNSILL